MTYRVALAGLMLLLPLRAVAAAPQSLSISNGWFALAPRTPVIAFFSIRNAGQQARLVTGWQSPGCQAMHLEEANGEGKNDGSSGLTIPAESRMAFVRGSYHLSCDGPNQAMRAGTAVPVTFSFRDGSTLTAPFEVRDVGGHQQGQGQAGDTHPGRG